MRATRLAVLAAALAAATSVSAENVKIGFVTTLTTPAAVLGNDMRDAANLAIEHLGGKAGSHSLEIVFADDEFNPKKGKQATERLVRQDKVDIVTGYIWSHVLLASSKVVLDSGKILVSANAGPSQLAGKGCHKNFFAVSWQNDQTPMAMGEVLNQRGVKSLYVIAPNYAAGKNMVAGVERTFKGKIVGKDMTKWPSQLDWAAELSKVKAANPDGVFVFYPGKHGGAFASQYQQAGLQGKVPLYTVFTVDSISLPRFQKANMTGVMGSVMTQFWGPDLDNPQNKKFVDGFRARYGRYPSFYAAQSYDAINMIADAVEAAGGAGNADALRERMRKAEFPTVRGAFGFGPNHFPVQNFYSRQVVEDADGNWTTTIRDLVLKDHSDPYVGQCKMRG